MSDRPIIGGIFGTQTTQWDEQGNVTIKKDEFHLRIYKDLWKSGAIHKLKGNMLHVYLTIAMHLDNEGKGWPTQEKIANMCGISRNTVVTAIKNLIKEGFIDSEKVRTNGKFDNTVYKIKFSTRKKEDCHDQEFGTEKSEENKGDDHRDKKLVTAPCPTFQHEELVTKEDLDLKKDLKKKDSVCSDEIYSGFSKTNIAWDLAFPNTKFTNAIYQKLLNQTEDLLMIRRILLDINAYHNSRIHKPLGFVISCIKDGGYTIVEEEKDKLAPKRSVKKSKPIPKAVARQREGKRKQQEYTPEQLAHIKAEIERKKAIMYEDAEGVS